MLTSILNNFRNNQHFLISLGLFWIVELQQHRIHMQFFSYLNVSSFSKFFVASLTFCIGQGKNCICILSCCCDSTEVYLQNEPKYIKISVRGLKSRDEEILYGFVCVCVCVCGGGCWIRMWKSSCCCMKLRRANISQENRVKTLLYPRMANISYLYISDIVEVHLHIH